LTHVCAALVFKSILYVVYFVTRFILGRAIKRKDTKLLFPIFTFFVYLIQDLYFDIVFVDADLRAADFWVVLGLDNFSSFVKFSTVFQENVTSRIPDRAARLFVNVATFLSGDLADHGDDLRKQFKGKKLSGLISNPLGSANLAANSKQLSVPEFTQEKEKEEAMYEEGRGGRCASAPGGGGGEVEDITVRPIAREISKQLGLFSEVRRPHTHTSGPELRSGVSKGSTLSDLRALGGARRR